MSDDDTKHNPRTLPEQARSAGSTHLSYAELPPLEELLEAHLKRGSAATIRLDDDVLRWFQRRGPDYAEQINQILRQYINDHERDA